MSLERRIDRGMAEYEEKTGNSREGLTLVCTTDVVANCNEVCVDSDDIQYKGHDVRVSDEVDAFAFKEPKE